MFKQSLTCLLLLTAQSIVQCQVPLNNWMLELPVKADTLDSNNTKVKTIFNQELANYTDEFFYSTADGLVFNTPVFPPNGQPQSGTPFVSTFLRESNQDNEFVTWDSTIGTHSLTATLAVNGFPGTTNAKMIAAEIKLDSSICVGCTSVALFAYAKSNPIAYSLAALFDNLRIIVPVDNNYQLGTKFDIEILVVKGSMYFYYNGELKTKTAIPTTEKAVYFKAGAFSQNQVSYFHPATGKKYKKKKLK
ncbi:hypothetical protein HK099_004751 [Clydaea vesicula]|uniref:Alginate lyase 2 domain-containing protein n=1 Tax=Clydaea vesicula TaxID=447962 RepID=A0AAD5XVE4_9FUNG|nr:hypothetical protein HK099_004751 [Clydaea vesicula]